MSSRRSPGASAPTGTPTRRRSSWPRRASPATRRSRRWPRERINESGEDAVAAIQAAAGSFAEQLAIARRRAAGGAGRGRPRCRGPDRPAAQRALPTAGDALDRPAIVVADDLPPSMTATLPRERLLGIALEGSSPTAHAAILARAYGIPAVVGVRRLARARCARRRRWTSAEVAIDGAHRRGRHRSRRRRPTALRRGRRSTRCGGTRRTCGEATRPAVTLDGVEVALLANIGTPDESDAALALGRPGRRSVPDRVPLPRADAPAVGGRAGRRLRARRPRRSLRRPGHDPAARHRRRQADPVPADRRPRRTRSSASAPSASRTPTRACS